MKRTLAIFFFGMILLGSAARADDTGTKTLQKSDIKTLKMFSVHEDRIIVFVTDQSGMKYRLGAMPKTEVDRLIALLKSPDSHLSLEAKPVAKKKYLEVTAWK